MLIPLASSSSKSNAPRFDASRLVNMYARPADSPSAKSQFYLEATAGLTLFADTEAVSAVRALFVVGDVLHAVVGQTCYRIAENGTVTALTGAVLGGDKIIDAQTFEQGALVTENGSYGLNQGATAVTQITDASFRTATSVAAQNQKFVFSEINSARYFGSALNNVFGYNALDFATAERTNDRLVRVAAGNTDLYLFGRRSMEVARPNDSFYSAMTGAVYDVGIAGKHAVGLLNNTLFWLANDKSIYAMTGYAPQMISSRAIATIIGEDFSRFDDCEVVTHTDLNHKFVCFNFPTGRRTLVFDTTTGLWHERQSYVNNANRAWRARQAVICYGKTLVGDAWSGKIYEVRSDVYDEVGEEVRRTVEFSLPLIDTKGFSLSRLEVIMETGRGGNVANGDVDPIIELEISKDGGRTYYRHGQDNAGLQGQYKRRVVFQSLGHFTLDATFRLRVSSKTPWRIIAVDAT